VNLGDLFNGATMHPQVAGVNYSTVSGVISAARAVSCGLVIKPLGNVMGSQGIMTVVYVPQDVQVPINLSGSISNETLKTYPMRMSVPLNKIDDYSFIWRPTTADNLSFNEFSEDGDDSIDVTLEESFLPYYNGGFMVLIEGYEPGTDFQFNWIINFEGLPANTTWAPGLTSSVSDQLMIDQTFELLKEIPIGSCGDISANGRNTGGIGVNGTELSRNFKIYSNPTISPAPQIIVRKTIGGGTHSFHSHSLTRLGIGGLISSTLSGNFEPVLDRVFTEWIPGAYKFIKNL